MRCYQHRRTHDGDDENEEETTLPTATASAARFFLFFESWRAFRYLNALGRHLQKKQVLVQLLRRRARACVSNPTL